MSKKQTTGMDMEKGITEKSHGLPWIVSFLTWCVQQWSTMIYRSDTSVNRKLISITAKVPVASLLAKNVPSDEDNKEKRRKRKPPSDGVWSKDYVYDDKIGAWLRVYVVTESASKPATLPVVVFFHGGGFCTCSAGFNGFNTLCRNMARKLQVVVVSVDYRLAPEHKCPAAYADSLMALTWLGKNVTLLPPCADLRRCILMGDSAGGNIVHHIGNYMASTEAEETGLNVNVVGHVLVQPFFGGQCRTPSESEFAKGPLLTLKLCDWYWNAFLPVGADRDHHAAGFRSYWNPLREEKKELDVGKLPPCAVVIGGMDLLQDRQLEYVEFLKEKGNDVEVLRYSHAVHGFYVLPCHKYLQTVNLYSRFLMDLGNFIRRCAPSS